MGQSNSTSTTFKQFNNNQQLKINIWNIFLGPLKTRTGPSGTESQRELIYGYRLKLLDSGESGLECFWVLVYNG